MEKNLKENKKNVEGMWYLQNLKEDSKRVEERYQKGQRKIASTEV